MATTLTSALDAVPGQLTACWRGAVLVAEATADGVVDEAQDDRRTILFRRSVAGLALERSNHASAGVSTRHRSARPRRPDHAP